ncbi:MAG: sugar transferase [Saprospiraceae bacterium]|nr:sugar transferase [Saprospiraceae bacterium]MDW8485334.1 sugar transferase [Saprospiraceae bacterium]
MQRLFDIILSSTALVVLLPLFVIVAILLRFTGEGQVIYRQERVGKGGKLFMLYKFVTMLKNSEFMGTGTVTLKDDPRILPVGRILRKTKINELPQLVNVLKGDMSIVGPRPQTRRCFDAFPENLRDVIVKVKPGLSGIGSIVFRNEENVLSDPATGLEFYDNVIAPYKGQLEEWYVNNQGLYTYFAVILATLLVILKPKSNVVWRLFPNLPIPPESLRVYLNWHPKTSV